MRQILELAFSGSASRYDGRRTDPHPRVVCLICERIDHPDFAEPAILRALIAETTGYDVTNHRLDFFGTCPDCQSFWGGRRIADILPSVQAALHY